MTTIFTNRRLATDDTQESFIGRVDPLGWARDIFILEPGTHSVRNGVPHPCVAAGDYPLELRKTVDAAGNPVGKYAQFLRRQGPTSGLVDLHDVILEHGLPHLVMHPDRLALIHPGTTVWDTEACSLPGYSRTAPRFASSGPHWEVHDSRRAFIELYGHIVEAVLSGGAVWRVVDVGA